MTPQDRFKNFVKQSKWIFSKTYATTYPHEYCLLENSDPIEFLWCVQYIRDNGVEKPFWRKKYIYLEFEGYKYWTMGNPLPETTVINRAVI